MSSCLVPTIKGHKMPQVHRFLPLPTRKHVHATWQVNTYVSATQPLFLVRVLVHVGYVLRGTYKGKSPLTMYNWQRIRCISFSLNQDLSKSLISKQNTGRGNLKLKPLSSGLFHSYLSYSSSCFGDYFLPHHVKLKVFLVLFWAAFPIQIPAQP